MFENEKNKPMTHALKTVQPYFNLVAKGEKPFDVRKNDRPFKVGDKLLLQEYDDKTGYTGAEWSGNITYVMDDPKYVKTGFVILGIKETEI